MSRPAQYGSIMMYVNQNNGNIIEVAVDQFGTKTSREFTTSPIEETPTLSPINIEDRIKSLEEKVDKLLGGKEHVGTEQ